MENGKWRMENGEFKIIIISLPDFFEGETALVNTLFEQGMQRLHLRKPQATEQQMAEWIEQIAHPFRHRIVLHDHHHLAIKYHLGGIHLNSRNPSPNIQHPTSIIQHPTSHTHHPFTLSRSCHSLDEVIKYKSQCDYLFLSPIYDSISKQGYGATFTKQEIIKAHEQGIIDQKVYALGGVRFANIPELKALGFGGAAILGDLWLSPRPIDFFKESL